MDLESIEKEISSLSKEELKRYAHTVKDKIIQILFNIEQADKVSNSDQIDEAKKERDYYKELWEEASKVSNDHKNLMDTQKRMINKKIKSGELTNVEIEKKTIRLDFNELNKLHSRPSTAASKGSKKGSRPTTANFKANDR